MTQESEDSLVGPPRQICARSVHPLPHGLTVHTYFGQLDHRLYSPPMRVYRPVQDPKVFSCDFLHLIYIHWNESLSLEFDGLVTESLSMTHCGTHGKTPEAEGDPGGSKR